MRIHGSSPDDKSDDFWVIDVFTGWTPAAIVNDWNPEDDTTDSKVLMQLYGQIADPCKPDHKPAHNIYWKVNREHVMRMNETQAPVEISVFVVCWWNYWNAKNRMLRSHNVANEQMIFVDVQGILGPGQTALVFHVCPVRISECMLRNTTNTRHNEKSVFPVVTPPDPCQVCLSPDPDYLPIQVADTNGASVQQKISYAATTPSSSRTTTSRVCH